MKLIDAEPIIKNLSAMKTKLGYDAIEIDGMIKALREAEEVTAAQQPNDPLALEELREMDGEPVWCAVNTLAKKGYYCLCDRGLILAPSGSFFDCEDIPSWIFYRRKPEDKNNEPDRSC